MNAAEGQCRPAVTAANTAAMAADNAGARWTTVECRPSIRTTMDGFLDDVPTPTDQKVGGSSPCERASSERSGAP